MKLKVVLVVSLLLNLWLAAKWLGSRPPVAEVVSTDTAPPVPVVEKKVATRPTAKFDWRLVESEDYRQYIQNLRAIGCPEETIRDIIVADVNKLYETKRLSLVSAKDDFKFWKAGQSLFSTTDGVKLQAEMKVARELMDEKRTLLKELLGVDIPDSALAPASVTAPQHKMLAFLPADKRMQVQDLDQKYNVRRMQSLPGGAMGASAGEALRKLEAEKAAELAKILTPQELEEYHLRTHPTAMTMRLQLTGFEPNEEEFREIFHAKKAYDEQYGGFFGVAPRNAEEHEKKLKAEGQFQNDLEKALSNRGEAERRRYGTRRQSET